MVPAGRSYGAHSENFDGAFEGTLPRASYLLEALPDLAPCDFFLW